MKFRAELVGLVVALISTTGCVGMHLGCGFGKFMPQHPPIEYRIDPPAQIIEPRKKESEPLPLPAPVIEEGPQLVPQKGKLLPKAVPMRRPVRGECVA